MTVSQEPAVVGAAGRAGPARDEVRLRDRLLRGVHRADRWAEHQVVPDSRRARCRDGGHHRRGRVGDDWTAIVYDTGTFKAPWIPGRPSVRACCRACTASKTWDGSRPSLTTARSPTSPSVSPGTP